MSLNRDTNQEIIARNRALIEAINDSNIITVNKILADSRASASDLPCIDINNLVIDFHPIKDKDEPTEQSRAYVLFSGKIANPGKGEMTGLPALHYAFLAKPINENIVIALLNYRDKENELVIDINHQNVFPDSTAVTVLLSLTDKDRIKDPSSRARMLQAIIDLNGQDGEMQVNLTTAYNGGFTLLGRAIELGDPNYLCFNILADLGILDINELESDKKTILDRALVLSSKETITEIILRGGKKAEWLIQENHSPALYYKGQKDDTAVVGKKPRATNIEDVLTPEQLKVIQAVIKDRFEPKFNYEVFNSMFNNK